MEKSIESIWKEGFLKREDLVVPKLNNLYNKKSIDIVEKFRKMYKINIIAIIVFACILLPVATISHLPYMGMLLFISRKANYSLINLTLARKPSLAVTAAPALASRAICVTAGARVVIATMFAMQGVVTNATTYDVGHCIQI